ncbi:MAG: hypothetical protein ACMXYF_05915 [Candidatus Woesearchaeota archaeon]
MYKIPNTTRIGLVALSPTIKNWIHEIKPKAYVYDAFLNDLVYEVEVHGRSYYDFTTTVTAFDETLCERLEEIAQTVCASSQPKQKFRAELVLLGTPKQQEDVRKALYTKDLKKFSYAVLGILPRQPISKRLQLIIDQSYFHRMRAE